MSSWVMHVDIDAFFAQVEQVRNPELAARPVAVGNGVVASASYEARRRGVGKGMPLTQARRLVPELVILDGHHHVYRCFAERVFEVAREFAPPLETYLDEVYLDLTGSEGLYGGDLLGAALRLKKRVRAETGLAVTAAVAPNRMLAKMAGGEAKPDGLALVGAGEEARFVAGRAARELPGVGYRRGEVLARLNVHTVDDLRALSVDDLTRLFGATGRVIYQRARGRDPGPLKGRALPMSISRETSFHADTIDRAEVEGMLHYLTERAMRACRQLGLAARTVEVRVRLGAGEGRARARSFLVPTTADAAAYAVALTLLGEIWPRRDRLHLVGTTLRNFVPWTGAQSDLFSSSCREDPAFYRGLDEVRDRFGHGSLVAGRSLILLRRLDRDRYGYVLRTPSLTK